MTCEQLAQNGPGGKQFLRLTDVRLCAGGHAFHRDMDAALETYIPFYSARLGREPRPGELTLVLEILDDRDRERLLGSPNVGELPCQIRPNARLEPWAQQELATKYPGIALAPCRVVTVGLQEPTVARANRSWW